jgi:hypothetical protein
MPVTFSAADAPTLVRYAFEGDWTVRDFLECRRKLLRAGLLTTKTAVLFDLRQATTFPSLGDLQPALNATPMDAIWPVCRAFLVTTEAQYDGARQLQALLGPQSVINEIFRDEASAFEWLSAMAGGTPPIRA